MPDGTTDTGYNDDVSVYVQYLGTLTPALGTPPLTTFHITDGVATNQSVDLPPTFGPTTLWIDDDQSTHPTYATGTSPTLWYEDPTVADVQTPSSETALDALLDSPLAGKQVTVAGSRYGATGRLVVTSVFSQGYTVQDKPDGKINFERYEAALINVHDAVVCQLDDDFDTYGQWKLDPSGQGGDCSGKRGTVINVVTSGVITDLDPATLVDQTLPSVVGVLRSVDTIPVWIIYPRSKADLTLQ